MGMINLGVGLSELGKSVANTAGDMALTQQKSNLEAQKIQLANSLAVAGRHTENVETGAVAKGDVDRLAAREAIVRHNSLYPEDPIPVPPSSPQASSQTPTTSSSTDMTGATPQMTADGYTPPSQTPAPLSSGKNSWYTASDLPPNVSPDQARNMERNNPGLLSKLIEDYKKIHTLRQGETGSVLDASGGQTNLLTNPNPNEPFIKGPDGKMIPNQAFQDWELKKQAAGKSTPPAEGAKWEILTDPKNNQQYRYDPVSAKATTLAGEPYTPGGAQKIGGGAARSAQAMAVQRFLQDNPGATADDIAHFSGMYQKTVSQLGGETKADVAALTQITKLGVVASAQENALTGAISQVNTLMNKGSGTSVGPVVNRWLQAGRKATGDPDVAAFNTAVETAANEYAKIITGSTAATDASRAEAASMMDKFQSPAALSAQIGVIQKDAHYKIQSYADHSDFIKQKLNDGGQSGASIPSSPTNAPVQIHGDADYNALPPHTEFIAPDGSHRRKP